MAVNRIRPLPFFANAPGWSLPAALLTMSSVSSEITRPFESSRGSPLPCLTHS